ncbi:hypothetical protein D3C87_1533320 [compost metagenome]
MPSSRWCIHAGSHKGDAALSAASLAGKVFSSDCRSAPHCPAASLSSTNTGCPSGARPGLRMLDAPLRSSECGMRTMICSQLSLQRSVSGSREDSTATWPGPTSWRPPADSTCIEPRSGICTRPKSSKGRGRISTSEP